ncbi:glycerol-3-phosphate 1-O-acyltransferase PlsY [Pseudoxanthomonas mexicana]|uniref:glycerol-3-phosphate 1-O-acyltransferase PlsY n=1 Tax=Pseudoxanthomonas mexicana TaxID=128785 RepID=UPI001FD6A0BE|nr:glycerol-3-phosphate 1-O-acyltransferase PlsY [Pseudoxanthomonas mexicana]UOV00602.1 glycerol-3-phosphate 1-O-acyltransferase PlsY [Pseudoxanthomonas mexicana]
MLIVCFLLLLAYLSGSVSGSLTLGRLRGVDIRTQGSGNAGGTNAFRTQGAKFALGVVLIDIGKGALAAWLALRFAPVESMLPVRMVAWLAVLAAALGHVWPLWHGFRGGKGVGTLLGGVAVLWPVALLPLFLVWVCVLVASGYVGLASIIATACLLPLAVWLRADVATQAFAAVAALLVLFTHRANVQRLRAGTESRFERVRFWRRRA